MITWSISVVLLFGIWLWIARKANPQTAIGVVVLLSIAIPSWCQVDVLGVQVEAKVVSTILCLVAYCFHPRSTFPWQLGLLDFWMLTLLAIHALSDIKNSGISWYLPLRIYGEWCVPYLAGRLAFQQSSEETLYVKVGAAIGFLLAIHGIIEAVIEIHPLEYVFGERHYDGISRDAHRWGILRAWGPCAHPIYFSAMQLMLLPMSFRLCKFDISGLNKRFLLLIPCVCIAGIISTGTRSAIIGIMVFAISSTLILKPWTRLYASCAVMLLLIFSVFNYAKIIEMAHTWGNEQIEHDFNPTAIVDNEQVQVTSLLSRIHILKVYRRAAYRAGPLGFGTESVTGFPISVPVGPEDSSALRLIKYIDNEYLLLAIRFGWLGLAAFVLILSTSISRWIRKSNNSFGEARILPAFYGSSMAAVALMLVTVWMPHDIGFPLLFLAGGASVPMPWNWAK